MWMIAIETCYIMVSDRWCREGEWKKRFEQVKVKKEDKIEPARNTKCILVARASSFSSFQALLCSKYCFAQRLRISKVHVKNAINLNQAPFYW